MRNSQRQTRRRRRCHACSLLILLTFSLSSSCAQQLRVAEGTGLRLISHKTASSSKAAPQPRPNQADQNNRAGKCTTRISDPSPSMAEHMASLLASSRNQTSSEFLDRFLRAMQEEEDRRLQETAASILQQNTSPWTDETLLWVVTSIAFSAVASAFCTPKIFAATLKTCLSSLAILVPWVFMDTSRSDRILLVDLFVIFQFLRLQGFDNYMTNKVLPVAWQTLEKMLMMEAWKRVWTFVGRRVGKSIPLFRPKKRAQATSSNTRASMWEKWWLSMHDFVDAAIRKGSHVQLRKGVEHNVQATIHTAVNTLVEYTDHAVTSLFFPSNLIKVADPSG